ncbi:EamA family transporter [Asticcacaulis sp. EMRT-3]|uniref:EamA family transporter n=1 Tax=Asticcacaulis sp. EMRT-3 TaxID=3040349 RepID=UPI0024AEC773|nr:EamA family transporter [Asticcacaulis sp. EMRT-3]MDI7776410.1 EamA family transporter [Asticcacaulis sp. EMRT-3]
MKTLIAAWPFWALLSAIFAAMTAVLAKVGVSDINSDMATFLRTVVILVVSALVLFGLKEWRPVSAISLKTWIFLTLSGVATGASWLCYFRALKLGEAARVAPIDKLSVVFVAVFSVLFLGESLSLKNWLGVALIAGGAILVAFGT